MKIEERLALNKFDVDQQAHIVLNEEICQKCQERVCLYVCPAECYKLKDSKLILKGVLFNKTSLA